MKIQSLAIMFIILILPISLVLSSYTQNRVETLSLQARYDSRLNSATYDALKAYQLNSFNSDSGSLVNSKIRDIKASSNAFFTALASNFSTDLHLYIQCMMDIICIRHIPILWMRKQKLDTVLMEVTVYMA